MPQQQWGQPP
jgi:hypothetical protein